MKKSKVMTGPVREIPPQETKEETQVTEPQAEETQSEETQTKEETPPEEPVKEPDSEAGKIDTENITMTVYDDKNTPSQPNIPWKYTLWSILVILALITFGLMLATKSTFVPVNVVEVDVECGENGDSFMVFADDLEHSKVDIFYDNQLINPRMSITAKGFLYNNLEPGTYTVHILDVRRSYINYGVKTITLNHDKVDYSTLTEAVAGFIKALPDEGNKKAICADLITSFEKAATPGCVDLATRKQELVNMNNIAMGFVGGQKLNDESVWFNVFRKNGLISQYMDSQGLTVTLDNYTSIFKSIAQGIREGSK